MRTVPGAPIRRPGVMVECFRKAYKEAKHVYKGLPPTALEPQDANKPAPLSTRVTNAINNSGKAYEPPTGK